MLMASENWVARWQGIPRHDRDFASTGGSTFRPDRQSIILHKYVSSPGAETRSIAAGILQALEDARQAIPAQISMTRAEPPSSCGYSGWDRPQTQPSATMSTAVGVRAAGLPRAVTDAVLASRPHYEDPCARAKAAALERQLTPRCARTTALAKVSA